MFVARGRRKVAHRRCAMSLPEGHEHRHIAPRWGAVPSAVCSTNIQLLTELRRVASLNIKLQATGLKLNSFSSPMLWQAETEPVPSSHLPRRPNPLQLGLGQVDRLCHIGA